MWSEMWKDTLPYPAITNTQLPGRPFRLYLRVSLSSVAFNRSVEGQEMMMS